MPISEAARADLYTGLSEVLGPDRAETLMAQLPRFDPVEVATRTDLADLRTATKSDLADLRTATKSDLDGLRADMIGEHGELRAGLAAVNQRLDRLFLTLLVGMFGVTASLISLVFTLA